MKDYEITVLFRGTLEERELDKEMKALDSLLSKAGAKVKNDVKALKKTLAYEIKKNHEAYYAYYEVACNPDGVAGLNNALKNFEAVIRYLVIVKE